ncbi:MAG: cellulase family glycosylhydrolase [Rhizobiaceae bacterium]|nr:cellulase family glycosylhydrolase [Rhizobiaceae bacterium]
MRRGAKARAALCGAIAAIVLMVKPAAAGTCKPPEGFPNPALVSTMQRGVNLPNWDHPDPAARPTTEQLRAVRGHGFTHIRLLVERPPLADGEAQQEFAQALFEQIVLLLSMDYTVSVDLHAGHLAERYLDEGPDAARTFLSGIWRRLAPVIRVFDRELVAVELLNEPPANADVWEETARGLVADIRQWLPDHTIIVGPAGPQRFDALAHMEPLADSNIIYAVHYYDPFLFTHQGATWGGPDDPLQYIAGLPFPAHLDDDAVQASISALENSGRSDLAYELADQLVQPWTEAGIADAFSVMADWRQRTGQPVVVNEFGTLSFVAPRHSRLAWLAAVSRQAAAACIGWTHWDFQDGFGLMDPETGLPDPGVVEALVPSMQQDY